MWLRTGRPMRNGVHLWLADGHESDMIKWKYAFTQYLDQSMANISRYCYEIVAFLKFNSTSAFWFLQVNVW